MMTEELRYVRLDDTAGGKELIIQTDKGGVRVEFDDRMDAMDIVGRLHNIAHIFEQDIRDRRGN